VYRYNLGAWGCRLFREVTPMSGQGEIMDSHVYKIIQVTGTSTSSADEAVRTAVERAAVTVHNLKWFKVTETRGYIKDGRIAQWQVSVDLGFALE
jgi:flavin-binding protein dodecin